jgi:signal transduction histidine kinase
VGVALAGVAAALFTFGGSQGVDDFVWATIMLNVLPVAAARAFRQHERLHALLEERAAQLEVQRDERARLAVAQERERIAGELHDVVAHGVSAMVVQAAAARRLIAVRGDSEPAHEAIADVEASGRAALDELRRLLGVLRRGDEALALAPQPSLARVDRLVARLQAEGVPVDLAVEGQPVALPPGLDVTAYRIVEEALTVVLRGGGGPGCAHVLVRYGGRALELEVTDEAGGVGASGSRPGEGEGGFGLRERVALFGGELHAGRRRGGAWALQARLPLEREPA